MLTSSWRQTTIGSSRLWHQLLGKNAGNACPLPDQPQLILMAMGALIIHKIFSKLPYAEFNIQYVIRRK